MAAEKMVQGVTRNNRIGRKTENDFFRESFRATREWVKTVDEEIGWNSEQYSFAALKVLLQALRDRLTIAEGAELAAQLPLVLQGVFYQNWQPDRIPVKMDRASFLVSVREAFVLSIGLPVEPPKTDATVLVQGVFRALHKKIAEGDIRDVQAVLPTDWEELWPERASAAEKEKTESKKPAPKAHGVS